MFYIITEILLNYSHSPHPEKNCNIPIFIPKIVHSPKIKILDLSLVMVVAVAMTKAIMLARVGGGCSRNKI